MRVEIRLAKDVVVWLREIERTSRVPLDQVVAVLLAIKAKELKYERQGQKASSRRGR